MNGDCAGSDNFRRHRAFNFDRVHRDPAETLHVGLLLYGDLLRSQTPGDFAGEIDCDRFVALKIAPQFPFNQSRATDYAGTAEIAFAASPGPLARRWWRIF